MNVVSLCNETIEEEEEKEKKKVVFGSRRVCLDETRIDSRRVQ